MTITLNCHDCGTEVLAHRRNTKYCKLCRLYRNVVWLARRTSTCVDCQSQFAPLHRNDVLCSDCDFLAENNPRGRCGFCENDDTLRVATGVALCTSCAKDPELRPKVVAALANKRKARRLANEAAA